MSVDEGWNKVKDVMKQSGYGLGKNEGGVGGRTGGDEQY